MIRIDFKQTYNNKLCTMLIFVQNKNQHNNVKNYI